MTEKAVAVQTAKEPVATIKPLTFEGMAERVNKVFDAISRRAYELFEGKGRTPGRELEDWFKAEGELLHPVHIQMTESDDAFEVKAEVPGFTEKELEVSVEPTRVVITGKRESTKEEKKGKAIYTETCSDQIMRVVDLPTEVNAEKTVATLKNGVMELTLPKVGKAEVVKIQPKVAA